MRSRRAPRPACSARCAGRSAPSWRPRWSSCVTGTGEPLLGRVLVLDALRGRWSEVPLLGAVPTRGTTPPPRKETRMSDVPVTTAPELSAGCRPRGGTDDFLLIDVREPAEFTAGAIPGACWCRSARCSTARRPRRPAARPGDRRALPGRRPVADRRAHAAGGSATTRRTVEGGILADGTPPADRCAHLDEHRAAALALGAPAARRRVPLDDADGWCSPRTSAATSPSPRWDNSAMDGFAVRFADVATPRPDAPVTLRVVADLPAGTDARPAARARARPPAS